MVIKPPALKDRQLDRVIYSNWDFQQALSALIFLQNECDFERKYSFVELRRFRCFEASAIISFCRPFESSRGTETLGLKALGIKLNQNEQALKDRMLLLRRKVIAHSDDELMHFRGVVLQPLDDLTIKLPLFRYSETLYLTLAEIQLLETTLRRLIANIGKVLFAIAQHEPHRLDRYRAPVTD